MSSFDQFLIFVNMRMRSSIRSNFGAPQARSLHDELEAEPIRIRPDHPSLDDYVFSGFVGKPQGDDLPNAKSFAGRNENP